MNKKTIARRREENNTRINLHKRIVELEMELSKLKSRNEHLQEDNDMYHQANLKLKERSRVFASEGKVNKLEGIAVEMDISILAKQSAGDKYLEYTNRSINSELGYKLMTMLRERGDKWTVIRIYEDTIVKDKRTLYPSEVKRIEAEIFDIDINYPTDTYFEPVAFRHF